MRRLRGCAVAAIFLATFGASAARAETSRTTSGHSGDYLALVAFGSLAQVDDTRANAGTVLIHNDSDGSGGVGLALGYNWSKKGMPLRSELELHYRFRFDYDMRIANQAGYENNLHTQALLANLYYDFSLSERWTAYVGGGIGWARNNSEVERVALLGGAKTKRDDTTDSLAWNVALGVVWQVSENWDLDARYRYIDLGEIETGPHSDGTTFKAQSYFSHDFLLGLIYRF